MSLLDSSGAALHKEKCQHICLYKLYHNCCSQAKDTYLSSDSTLRRFSSRDYKQIWKYVEGYLSDTEELFLLMFFYITCT